jgi:hypothetical protein
VSVVLTEPGLYDGVPAEDYHADPVPGGSLSSTGARRLLPPSCPAKFRYYIEHGQKPRREFDLGHAAHRVLFGAGPEIVLVEADTYRTKAAQAQRDEARAAGRVPLLSHEHEQVQAMVAQVRAEPLLAALLDAERGKAEQTLVWRDQATGVMCRARLDWLSTVTSAGRRVLLDYKTAGAVDPDSLSRSMFDHGYYLQAAWYRAGVTAVLSEPTAFVFVAQEKEPPYLVTTYEPDVVALRWGQVLAAKALRLYARCQTTGRWPGYADAVIPLPLPPWAEYRLEDVTADPDPQEGLAS